MTTTGDAAGLGGRTGEGANSAIPHLQNRPA